MSKIKIFCDGASRGNPGPAGIGYLILDIRGKIIEEFSEFLGIKTNNEAEYYAAVKAIERALELGADEIELYADSELLINQLNGIYKVRDPKLVKLHSRIISASSSLKGFKAFYISREENMKADELANKAIDEWMKTRGKVLKFSLEAAELAGRIVKSGGVIIYPTDTVYGLGCDPLIEEPVKEIYRIKRRSGKPLPILVDGIESARDLGLFTEEALRLAYRAWPGQLTIVVEASSRLKNSPALLGSGKIGLRIPASLQAIEIIRRSGGALIGTSANITGYPPPRSVSELDENLVKSVELVIDGGKCVFGEPSTVIEIEGSEVKVLRFGALSFEKLKELMNGLNLSLKV